MTPKEVVETAIGIACAGIFIFPLVWLFYKFYEMVIYDLLGVSDEWRM